MKKRTKVPQKIRALLQREVDSSCPVLGCRNDDIGHFEIHHIDGNPSNNEFENLLLLCPTCHSKIEKGDILTDSVRELKRKLATKSSKIELHEITVDKAKCSWEAYKGHSNAFHLNDSIKKSPFPIFQFHIINHTNKTVVFQDVILKVRHIYSGMGDLPRPRKVPKSSIHRIIVNHNRDVHSIDNFNPIQIPSEQAYIFQIEVMEQGWENEYLIFDSRYVLNFTFRFSSNITLEAPKILLNTKDENEGLKLYLIG